MKIVAPPDTSVFDRAWKPSPLDAVLLAEDDPVFRHLITSWLRRWSYSVVAVDNGLDAWQALQQQNAPQLVVLDWMMPGMEGVELCRQIRSHAMGIYRYILLITAKDNKNDVVAGLEAGADDYLTKPFNVEELRARIRTGKRILQLQDELLKTQEALQFQAAHDPMTGLWNRGAILDLLRRETQLQNRTGKPFGVMMADVDYFKKINDSFGHLVGDAVLREVARRLATGVRGYDYIGRYGGEEFLIVVSACDVPELAGSAERLRVCVAREPIQTTAGAVSCTISIGAAVASQTANSLDYESVLRTSDTLLYQAKANGRNRVEVALAARVGAGQ